jgi:hypothetical protein
MNLNNLDHLIIKSKAELDKEYDDSIRALGVELITWGKDKGLTPKDLCVLCYNYYFHYQQEIKKLNEEKATEE